MYLYLAYGQFLVFLFHQYQINYLYSGIRLHLQLFLNCDQEKDEQQQIVAATTVKVKRKRADSVEQIQEMKEEKDVICPNVGKGGVDALSMLSNAYSFEDDDELAIK